MDRRLQHLPREQATLLAVRGQAGAIEGQHVAGRELFSFVDRFTLHFFEEHRGRRLANDAALPVEVGIADFAVDAEFELDANHIAAERVIILVCVRGGRQLTTVERVLVMIEDVLLVQFFFVDGHRNTWQGSNAKWISLSPVYEGRICRTTAARRRPNDEKVAG